MMAICAERLKGLIRKIEASKNNKQIDLKTRLLAKKISSDCFVLALALVLLPTLALRYFIALWICIYSCTLFRFETAFNISNMVGIKLPSKRRSLLKFKLGVLSILAVLFVVELGAAQETDEAVPAKYTEGQVAFMKYLAKNIHYPSQGRDAGVTGVVYASFLIDEKGDCDSIRIVRGLSPEFDQEVIRLLKQMGDWEPAKVNGNAAACWINLPIGFYMNHDSQSLDASIYEKEEEAQGFSVTMDEFSCVEYQVRFSDLQARSVNGGKTNLQLGIDAMEKGDYKTAKEHFTVLYRGDPTNPEVLLQLGVVKHKLGKTKAACAHWKRAEKLGNSEATLLLQEHCTE